MPAVKLIGCIVALAALTVSVDAIYYYVYDNCTSEDSACALFCVAEMDPGENYVESHWEYATVTKPTSRYVEISSGVSYENNGTNFTVTLALANYSAGYYGCPVSHTINSTGPYTTTIITTIENNSSYERVDMGGECESASHCWALNAQCDDTATNNGTNTCNCNGYFSIPYDDQPLTPACLQHDGRNESCNVDGQCALSEEAWLCVDHVCQCAGRMVNVAERNNALMCIQSVNPFESGCLFNEQCLLVDGNTFCYKGACLCVDGYGPVYGFTHYKCEWYIMGFGGVIGIFTAVIVGCALIGAIIYTCIRKPVANADIADVTSN